MYKYAGKENLFVQQTEIPQVNEDRQTVWFSDRLHTCNLWKVEKMFPKVRLIKTLLVSSTYLAWNRCRK